MTSSRSSCPSLS